jgi:hypothetical protein
MGAGPAARLIGDALRLGCVPTEIPTAGALHRLAVNRVAYSHSAGLAAQRLQLLGVAPVIRFADSQRTCRAWRRKKEPAGWRRLEAGVAHLRIAPRAT